MRYRAQLENGEAIPVSKRLYKDAIALCDDEFGQRTKLNQLVGDYLSQRPELTARLFAFESSAALLAEPRFILCGSSLVVNLHYVTSAEGSCFRLNDGKVVTLPRRSAA